jgi:hypothetical protein
VRDAVPVAIRCNGAVLVGLVAALCLAPPPAARAQGTWTANLAITPFPSAYLNDWEANPSISSLTLTNPTALDQSVILVYHISNQAGQVLASGRSDPQVIPAGPPTVFNSFIDIAGHSEHDAALEDQMTRTGRLPEGDYRACVVATDGGGFVLAETCAEFSIVYPDPPLLVAPQDGAQLTAANPIFQWTPLQVPVGYGLQYVLRIAEVLATQTPDEALTANIPLYENVDVRAPNLEYPISARPLEAGKTYAWRVQALDQHGYPPAANGGMSEVQTFQFSPGANTGDVPVGEFEVRITFFDPAGALPPLWATLDTASFDQMVTFLDAEVRRGVVEIPLPLPPQLRQTLIGQASDPDPRKPRGGGPAPAARPLVFDCSQLGALHGLFGFDKQHGAITLGFAYPPGSTPILDCLGLPGWMTPEVQQSLSLLLAIQYKAGGLPHVTLGIKPMIPGLLSHFGLNLRYAVFVLNLVGDFTIQSADLPDNVAEFYDTYQVPLWGQGQDDLLKNVASAIHDRSAKTALTMLGVNFYGVLDVGQSHLLSALFKVLCAGPVTVACVSDPKITLRGFAGNHGHGSTFRGVSLSGDAGFGAAGLERGDRWGLWAEIPTTPPSFLSSLVTSRVLQFELVSGDTSTTNRLSLAGEAPTRRRTRFVARDVLRGFDSWKKVLGVPADSTLAFFGEFKAELTGRADDTTFTSDTVFTRARSNAVTDASDTTTRPLPTQGVVTDTVIAKDTTSAWSRLQFSLAWGFKGTLQFGEHFRLFDPELRLERSDPSATALANPLKNVTVALSSDWGLANLGAVGDLDHLGTLKVSFGTRQRRVSTSTFTVDTTGNRARVVEDSTVTQRTRLQWKITARLSQDAGVDKLFELLAGLVPALRP